MATEQFKKSIDSATVGNIVFNHVMNPHVSGIKFDEVQDPPKKAKEEQKTAEEMQRWKFEQMQAIQRDYYRMYVAKGQKEAP